MCSLYIVKKIAVDIDNILWDFSPVFWERLRRINPDIIPPTVWNRWDFWHQYVTTKQLYGAIKEIHLEQEKFRPFDDASLFLSSLRDMGFYIIIASHREKGTIEPTERWLGMYRLVYDEIHLSSDKSVLFNDLCAVVDDSPSVLDKAKAAGIVRAGLRCPWNKDTDHPLFDTLPEILSYLKSVCNTAHG
ncbi:MAG TPA: hypothetical protein PK125_11355 [Syntrophorhabdus sp.]|nr:hypothetical protein [Syntrophorhabdus sp.]MDI9557430.1 hypothetical protein [Pseudomonadota bacterium]OPX95621.1 MAG: 5' nucleotidase, deoxy (Pyrimidine), cytosolic type C protein (NT5C) [Syntrophorhabdus sp. PtaB.Bin027]OQB76998.1 MAG: 5' nucleotidase, deoxy (Pyrimidine), cytosolic type C protein (NT5C) [Deltaproteobacteria bacterium ADurb.Bin135]HOD78880.1 hypothetical protein [Syntrophorhabdus sp.]